MKLFLDKNENSDANIRAIIASAVSNCNPSLYPNYDYFKLVLAKFLNVSPEYILPTSGCTEAIKIVAEAYGNKCSLIRNNTYEYAKTLIGVNSQNVVWYDDYMSLELDTFPNLIYLCNPNNPTGCVYTFQQIEAILIQTANLNCMVFVDETYYDFIDINLIPLLEKYPHLILGRSFSKAWGCAGLRMGYVLANPSVLALLDYYRLKASINTFGIAAVTNLIENKLVVKSSINKIRKHYNIMSYFIEANGGKVLNKTCTSNFIYFKDAEEAFAKKNSVIRKFSSGYNMVAIPSNDWDIARFLVY